MPRLTAIRKRALDEIMKEALFEATIAVLSEHGVKGLTMDRVAQAAGVAKGSLYNYFRSKKDLLEFVFAKVIDPILQHLAKAVAVEQPAVEKLADFLRMLLDYAAKHADVLRLLIDDETAHGLLQSSERSIRKAIGYQLAQIIRQGISEGAFRPGDPRMLAIMFQGLYRGVFDSRPSLESRRVREKIHALVMDNFLHGITAGTRTYVGGSSLLGA